MNSRNIVIGLIALAIGAVLVVSFGRRNQGEEPKTPETESRPVEKIEVEIPKGAIQYTLTDASSASYTVQKRFFNKPDIVVVGTTNNVSGMGWFDVQNQNFNLEAQVNLETLATDNAQRDSDIQPLFTDKIATLTATNSGSDEIAFDTITTLTVNTFLTINGATQEVPFETTLTISETDLTATGTANVKMSDFGIDSPSILEIFTVDDEIVLTFSIRGESIN